MNRPKLEDYKDNDCPTLEYDGVAYYRDLEKYCDELEQSNKSLSNAYDDCLVTLHFWEEEHYKLESKLKGLTGDYEAQADILHETKQELERYKKALDKVCELFEDCPFCLLDEELDCDNCKNENAKCWKKWAMKNETYNKDIRTTDIIFKDWSENDKKCLYDKLIKKYGIDKQLMVCAEECSELIKEIIKAIRGKGDVKNLIEEIADVEIMLEQVKLIYKINDEKVECVKKEKLLRTRVRLKEGNL